MLEAEKMSKEKDLSDYDNGQIVLTRWLGQSIPKMSKRVDCLVTLVNNYQNLVQVRQVVNYWKCHGCPRFTDGIPQKSHKIAIIAEIAKKKNKKKT